MFRRFMIVCWVLFTLTSLVGLVGCAGYWHFDGKIQGFYDMGYNPFWKMPPEPDEHTDDTPSEENPFMSLPDETEEALVVPEQNIHSEANVELFRVYMEGRQSFEIAGWIGASLAAVFLLWNILCHTVHWVWMGREGRGP